MEAFKQLFTRMNLDADARNLQPGEYRFLKNGIPIKPSGIDLGEDYNVASFVGNQIITNSNLQATSKVIGCHEDVASNRMLYAVYHSAGDHAIFMYDPSISSSIVLVMETTLFDFGENDFVDMDVAGDILIFTNNRSETKKINITKARLGLTYTPTLEEITLIKRPPHLPIEIASYGADGNPVNFIQKLHFQFFYRYIYEDNDYSVWGAVSKTAYATNSVDNTIVLSIPGTEVIPETVKQIDFAVRVNETNEMFIYKKIERSSGSFTLSHGFINNTYLETVANSEMTKWNDSVPKLSKSLRIFKNRVFTLNNTEGYDFDENDITSGVGISYAEVASGPVGLPYYKDGSGYDFGIMFFDGPGRHAGASFIGSIRIPDDRKGTATRPYEVTVDISLLSIDFIPLFATHFSIVRTNSDIPFFICDRSADTMYFKREDDGTITYNKVYAANNDGLAIDISSLARSEIGYTLQPGDRIKIYSAGSTHTLTFGVYDLEIKSQDGRFLYTDLKNLGATLSTIQADGLLFEIYTPATASIKNFFEVGNKYEIDNPNTVSRAFSVTSIKPDGDVTRIQRDSFDRAGYAPTDPYANTLNNLGGLLHEAANAVDKYFSLWIHRGGRAITANTINSQEKNKSASIRFSQTLIQNGLSQLNTFEALDEYQLPVENGAGTILAEAGDVLIAIHGAFHTALYIGEGFVNTTDANNFLAKTDSVIGDDRKYMAGFGTTIPQSVVSREGRVYSLDVTRGVVVRRSQDGLTAISDYGARGFISELCRYFTRNDGSQVTIVAGWDPVYECYVIAFRKLLISADGIWQFESGEYVQWESEDYVILESATYGSDSTKYGNVTLYFHEKTNSWVAANSLAEGGIEFFGTLGSKQIQFKAGGAWIQSENTNYNNWFGTQYNRELYFEPAPMASLEKIWNAIEIDADAIYVTAGTNEDVLLVYNKKDGTLETRINYSDFVRRASAWRSAFFRTLNDVSFGSVTESKYKSPHSVRGQSAYMKLTYNGTDRNAMKSITIFFRPSPQSTP